MQFNIKILLDSYTVRSFKQTDSSRSLSPI